MIDWFALSNELPAHPKRVKLARLLKLDSAAWYVVSLWAWCSKHSTHGVFDGAEAAADIETVVGWPGKPGAFVEAAVEVGFLDRDVDGSIVAHDFWMWNGEAIEKAEAKAEAKRLARAASRGVDDGRYSARHDRADKPRPDSGPAAAQKRPGRGQAADKPRPDSGPAAASTDADVDADVVEALPAQAPATPHPGAGAQPAVDHLPTGSEPPPEPVQATSDGGAQPAVVRPPLELRAQDHAAPRKQSWQLDQWDEMKLAKSQVLSDEELAAIAEDAGLPEKDLNIRLKRYADKFGREQILPAWSCFLRNEKNAALDPPYALQVFLTDQSMNRYVGQAKREAQEDHPGATS